MDHGLNTGALAVLAACLVLWGAVSDRLVRWNISAPTAFVVLGVATSHGPVHLVDVRLHSSTILTVAELTLAIVLFADAARVNVRAVREEVGVSARLLAVGLPLTIGAGTAVAFGLLNGTDLWVAAAIGAIVAPTDAALGAPIVQDSRLPNSLRRTLTIESGLNDGIATPFVNLFLAGALSAEALASQSVAGAAVDLLGGAALGLSIGIAGAVVLRAGERAGWSTGVSHSLSVLALAILAYVTSIQAGTNGFVAAFVAGMAYGSARPGGERHLSFTEDAGELLSLVMWFVFGAVMLVPGLEAAGWSDVLFAVVVLTAARMVPVALSLVRSGLDGRTVAFIGWFGPRGLASIVFGLLAIDSLDPAAGNVVLAATVTTVALSVFAHGVSAAPLARRYSARLAVPAQGAAGGGAETPMIRTRALSGHRRGAARA